MKFEDLNLIELDKDLSEDQKKEWNAIYASYRSASILTGRVIGIDINKIKSSPNIIDLIEVGDYVNGSEVYYTVGDLVVFDGGQDGEIYIKDKEIKTVVTKEQFESMEYKIND